MVTLLSGLVDYFYFFSSLQIPGTLTLSIFTPRTNMTDQEIIEKYREIFHKICRDGIVDLDKPAEAQIRFPGIPARACH